jgi:2-(1,2-epoxy-1,2-dihydrophenyl)acetyl-CoA isomerase
MPALQLSIENHIATLLLNRPDAKNAINVEMSDQLDAAMLQIDRDRDIRAVLITGAGGSFCAGGDVRAMNATAGQMTVEARRLRMQRAHRTVKMLAGLDRPIIAAVDGPAFGAGFSIALLADMVVATPRARFCMAFARIGLIPDYGALYTLPRIVGIARAKEIMFSAREVGAAEAKELGIVLELAEPAALLPRAQALACAMAGASPVAVSLTKSALNSSLGSDLSTMLDIEAAGQGIAGISDYAKESFRRFAAKEPAQFVWPAAGRV